MKRSSAKKMKYGIGILGILILLSIGYLTGLEGFINPYKTVSDVVSKPNAFQGKVIQMQGDVDQATVEWDPVASKLDFVLMDEKSRIPVSYDGALPSGFPVKDEEGSGQGVNIVATGILEGDKFAATQILVKCPSKYDS